MTTNPTDSSKVLLTGENSFIRLSRQNGALQTTRTSHWRVLLSPGGQGHVLFMKSDVANDEVRVYSNNIALARWLQETIESFLFPEFADQTLPVVDAVFNRSGDGRSFWTESVESDDDSIALTWHDFMEPYMLVNPAGGETNRPLEVWPESHWPGFALRQTRRIIVLYGMIVSVIRFKNPLLHRQSSLRKRRLGENRGFRPSF